MRYLKLSQLVEIIDGDRGNNYPKNDELFSDGYCLFLNTKNVTKSGFNFDECQFISESKDRLLRKGKIKYNDLVFTTRGTVGNVALYDTKVKYINIRINSGMVILRCNEYVLPSFMLFLLRSYNSQTQIRMRCTGSAQPQLPLSIMSDIEFPCPPLPIQRKIAGILSAYDDLIENNRRQIKLLEEAARRLYKEWFVDLRFPGHEQTDMVDGLPAGWERKKLGEIADIQYGFAFDGSMFNNNGDGIPILRIRNIPDGFSNDYTTEKFDENYSVNDGDIVVGMDGEFHINMWSGGYAALVQRTCCIKPKSSDMKGWMLNAIVEPIKFFEKTIVGATVSHLGKKHLDAITLIVPSKQYMKFFQLQFDSVLQKRKMNNLLQEARDRLLPKLMSGEIEVTPQSALEVPGG